MLIISNFALDKLAGKMWDSLPIQTSDTFYQLNKVNMLMISNVPQLTRSEKVRQSTNSKK